MDNIVKVRISTGEELLFENRDELGLEQSFHRMGPKEPSMIIGLLNDGKFHVVGITVWRKSIEDNVFKFHGILSLRSESSGDINWLLKTFNGEIHGQTTKP